MGTHGFHLPSVILHPKECLFCCSWFKSQGEPFTSLAHLHIALRSAMPLEGAYSYGPTICLCSLLSVYWEMNFITQMNIHLWHGCVVQTQSRQGSYIWSFCSLKGICPPRPQAIELCPVRAHNRGKLARAKKPGCRVL